MLLVRGIDRVLWDLAVLGYDAQWGVVSAENAGALHTRDRVWILANANMHGMPERIPAAGQGGGEVGIHNSRIFWGSKDAEWPEAWGVKPLLRRGGDGVADWVDRLHAIGNGQVPAVVRLAWQTLMGSSMHND